MSHRVRTITFGGARVVGASCHTGASAITDFPFIGTCLVLTPCLHPKSTTKGKGRRLLCVDRVGYQYGRK